MLPWGLRTFGKSLLLNEHLLFLLYTGRYNSLTSRRTQDYGVVGTAVADLEGFLWFLLKPPFETRSNYRIVGNFRR